MYISEIKLQNIKCFDNFDLKLEENGKPILWTMIFGDNAVGKSCLLRSLAIGLCDQASAAALIKELPGEMLREGEYEGFIRIKLKNKKGETFTIRTVITRKSLPSPERVKQKYKPNEDEIPWDDIFFCGYGPQRATEADRSFKKYIPIEAVYTLFNYTASLQNPEIIFQRQRSYRRKQLENRLLGILMLDKKQHSVRLSETGLEIVGPWGKFPVEVLSDGYKSTTNWVLDFFAWQIYAEKLNHSGILLIDEVEQHLHPRWQRYIIGRLRKQFPKIQFITTTHTPLVALGISEIDSTIMVKLEQDEGKRIIRNIIPIETVRGMRADQVLTSDVFGLPVARGGQIGDKMVRFRELYLKDVLKKSEKEEFIKLRRELLREIPSAGENEEDRKIRREIKELLQKLEKAKRVKG